MRHGTKWETDAAHKLLTHHHFISFGPRNERWAQRSDWLTTVTHRRYSFKRCSIMSTLTHRLFPKTKRGKGCKLAWSKIFLLPTFMPVLFRIHFPMFPRRDREREGTWKKNPRRMWMLFPFPTSFSFFRGRLHLKVGKERKTFTYLGGIIFPWVYSRHISWMTDGAHREKCTS